MNFLLISINFEPTL